MLFRRQIVKTLQQSLCQGRPRLDTQLESFRSEFI